MGRDEISERRERVLLEGAGRTRGVFPIAPTKPWTGSECGCALSGVSGYGDGGLYGFVAGEDEPADDADDAAEEEKATAAAGVRTAARARREAQISDMGAVWPTEEAV